jgi:hypothetical protein
MKRVKLLTKELEGRFAQVGRQEALGEQAVVVAKFFTPDSNWTWWATEYEPESREFFGLVQGFEVELGYFSLDELESATGPLGLPIERDKFWEEQTLGEVRRALETRRSA